MLLNKTKLLISASILAAACTTEPPADPTVMPVPTGPIAKSARGNLRFKGPERLNADFAAALELKPEALCTELGLYPCATAVHIVALGGVDPYGPGLYEAAGVTASATPLVVDRIAWSACTQRVTADLADPNAAVIFKGVPLNGSKLAGIDGAEVRGVIGLLTQRILLRNPYSTELTRYVKLAQDIEATGNAEPARAWMQSVCFAVLSSAESVFY